MRGLADAEGSAAGFSFLFKNPSLRLAFLLIVDGLGIFFGIALLLVSMAGNLSLVSREKEKAEPIEREKLKALPWLASVWQKSKHLVAKEDSLSPTAVILVCTSELVIFWEDQKITHASSLKPSAKKTGVEMICTIVFSPQSCVKCQKKISANGCVTKN